MENCGTSNNNSTIYQTGQILWIKLRDLFSSRLNQDPQGKPFERWNSSPGLFALLNVNAQRFCQIPVSGSWEQKGKLVTIWKFEKNWNLEKQN